MASEGRGQAPLPSPCQLAPSQNQQPLVEIHVISGGFAGGGESSSARKAHLRSIKSGETLEIQAVSKIPRLDTTITFSNSDKEGCQHPLDDPLLIRVVVANKTVHRVLVDNGTLADIIFASAFDKMGIGKEKLEPVNTHLWGFSGERVLPLRSIQFGRSPVPGHNGGKVPHSRCPIGLYHVIGQTLPQCHKGHPLRLSYGYQIPYYEWGRNGSRRLARSQGVLLGINETKRGWQHLHGRA